jgi:hypothetical protein
MQTIQTQNAHELRAILRAYRNEHYATAQAAGLGDSAAIGLYSTAVLREWCGKLGIEISAEDTPPDRAVAPAGGESAGDLMTRALAMLTPSAPTLSEEQVRAIVADEMSKMMKRMISA